MKALEFEEIYYKRGFFTLADVNFSVSEGEVVAISGRSGSGKTTLFELMGNVVRPAGGFIRYFGKEMYEDEANIRKQMSVMFTEPNFNGERRPDHFVKEVKRIEPSLDIEAFYEYIHFFELDDKTAIRKYSKGMRKKMMLAFYLSRNPRLLLMDEPTSGLDEKSKEEVFEAISRYKSKHELTIVFSTHSHDDMSYYADRVLTIENGGVR